MEKRKQIEEILLNDYGCFDDFTVDKLLDLFSVVGRSEQLKAFVDWWHGLSQEELAWYEGRYVEVFLSL